MKTIEQQILEKQDELIRLLTNYRYNDYESEAKGESKLRKDLSDLKAQLKEQELSEEQEEILKSFVRKLMPDND